jgi:hypothetical protein
MQRPATAVKHGSPVADAGEKSGFALKCAPSLVVCDLLSDAASPRKLINGDEDVANNTRVAMIHRLFARNAIAVMMATMTVLSTSAAWALTPTVVWQTAGAYPSGFSADGSVVYLSLSGGFQMRRATDGLLLKAINLPQSSLPFDKSAFSPDKQFVAISVVDANLATRIEIWSLSTGKLVRTIATDAVRNIRGLDFSPNSSFLASMERFAYGGGGKLRIFRTSDGSLLREQGPFVVNGNTFVKFSPGGIYLAFYQNLGNAGFNILRTSDWSTAQSINLGNQYMIQWAGADTTSSVWLRGDFSISVPYHQVTVPGGSVTRTLSFDDAFRHVSAVTSDNKYFLPGRWRRPTQGRLRPRRSGSCERPTPSRK